MAVTYTQAQAVSKSYFDTVIEQIIYDDSAFTTKLKQKNLIKTRGGNDIRFPIRYLRLDKADAIDPQDQITYESKSTRTQGVQPWTYYVAQALISWKERQTNQGEPEIVSLIKDKAQEMKDDFWHRFATDLFATSAVTKRITPLGVIVDSAATFAALAPADATTWASGEDASSTVMALYGANSLAYRVNQATFGKNHPTMHLTTRNLRSKFMSLFEGEKTARDDDLARAGFDNVLFMDGAVVSDAYCPASTWYGLDIDNWELRVDPEYKPKLDDWFELKQIGYPNALARVMTWAGNTCCKMRRTNFKFTLLNYQS